MNISDQNIAILYGGWSDEREVSLDSGKSVFETLSANGYKVYLFDFNIDDPILLQNFMYENKIDLVFNLIHGIGGEDGTVQHYIEDISIKSIGSDSKSSGISFNKILTKKTWLDHNLPTPNYCPVSQEIFENDTLHNFGEKIVLKPIESGSSVGIKILKTRDLILNDHKSSFDNLCNLIDKKFSVNKYFIEEYVDYPEYTAPIIAGKVYPIIKIQTKREFYNYDAKYIDNDTSFTFPEFPKDVQDHINEIALKAFNTLGCSTWGRVDFFMDDMHNMNLIEVNSIPGMTSHSLVPMSASKAGLSYFQLINLIITS
tara:strand:+ start:279 stop:1220 length:942 start_codon:yes stop_codon:yes gene_type:complete